MPLEPLARGEESEERLIGDVGNVAGRVDRARSLEQLEHFGTNAHNLLLEQPRDRGGRASSRAVRNCPMDANLVHERR